MPSGLGERGHRVRCGRVRKIETRPGRGGTRRHCRRRRPARVREKGGDRARFVSYQRRRTTLWSDTWIRSSLAPSVSRSVRHRARPTRPRPPIARQRNGIVSLPAPGVLLGLPRWMGQHASKAFRQCAALRVAGRLVLREKHAAAAMLQPELRRRNAWLWRVAGRRQRRSKPEEACGMARPCPAFPRDFSFSCWLSFCFGDDETRQLTRQVPAWRSTHRSELALQRFDSAWPSWRVSTLAEPNTLCPACQEETCGASSSVPVYSGSTLVPSLFLLHAERSIEATRSHVAARVVLRDCVADEG